MHAWMLCKLLLCINNVRKRKGLETRLPRGAVRVSPRFNRGCVKSINYMKSRCSCKRHCHWGVCFVLLIFSCIVPVQLAGWSRLLSQGLPAHHPSASVPPHWQRENFDPSRTCLWYYTSCRWTRLIVFLLQILLLNFYCYSIRIIIVIILINCNVHVPHNYNVQ